MYITHRITSMRTIYMTRTHTHNQTMHSKTVGLTVIGSVYTQCTEAVTRALITRYSLQSQRGWGLIYCYRYKRTNFSQNSHAITVQRVIFEALNFRGLLKLKHFADFIFEDRGSFNHNPTVNNDFEVLRSTSKTANISCLENNPLYGSEKIM